MIIINICESASYGNLPALKEIYRESWQLKEVNISYHYQKGLPHEGKYHQYPFKAKFQAGQTEIEIHIWSLTVGYGGTGPHDTADMLDFLGVKYEQSDIFTTRKMDEDGYIRLNYTL